MTRRRISDRVSAIERLRAAVTSADDGAAERVSLKIKSLLERSPFDTNPVTIAEAYARILGGRPADPTSPEADAQWTHRVCELLENVWSKVAARRGRA
jgi:hypothetical protein